MHKTLRQLQNEITAAGAAINRDLQQLNTNAANLTTEELVKARAAIVDSQNRLQELKDLYQLQANNEGARLGAKKEEKPMENSLKNRLASNEYAQAFVHAIRNGINKRTARNDEKCAILLDALTEAGGSPAGTDGGFLVPIDIDNMIREKLREYGDIASLFNEETVTAPTGWRVMDNAPTAGFSQISAEMAQIAADDQPSFVQVPYTVNKYGLRLPVSNELVNDEAANLFGYIANWYAKKLVITRNGIVINAMKAALTATDIKTDVLAGVKTAVNVTLDPAIAAGATFLTNQSCWDVLDQLKDGDDRAQLQPDPTNATAYRLLGHAVKPTKDTTLTGKDIFVGNYKQFGTLYTMGGFELASTDIGGDAWKTDSTEFRGLVRMGFSAFDTEAVARLTVKA